jgi:hypothetical protein
VTSTAPTSTIPALNGTASPGPEQPPSMFVLEGNSGAATPDGDPGTYELALRGVGGVTWFADRPQRRAGEETITRFVEAWPSRFADGPPNAALTIGQGDDADVAIVTLTDPQVEADTLRFHATVVEPEQAPPSLEDHVASRPSSELPTTFQRATLFVDPSGEQVKSHQIAVDIDGTRHFTLELDFDASIQPVGFLFAEVESLAGLPQIYHREHGLTIKGELAKPSRGLRILLDVVLMGDARTGQVSGQFDEGATVGVWGPEDERGARDGRVDAPPFSFTLPIP